MRQQLEDVTVEATIEASTAKAVLIDIDSLGKKLWVPRSQIYGMSGPYGDNDLYEIVITGWFANKEGIS